MNDVMVLAAAAASVGIVHTVLGPDHYLPFVVMARARKWTTTRTAAITVACGIGHVAGSVVLGFIGIALGLAIGNIEGFESFRGNIAAWMLTAFGLAYTVWGIRRALRNRPHSHSHHHANGSEHHHEHSHANDHLHAHANPTQSITPWVLFTIFLFGPCEPLIPILMYPAATNSSAVVALVAGIFSVATIGTMLIMVLAINAGAQKLPTQHMERWAHALAGIAVLACGIAIHLGL